MRIIPIIPTKIHGILDYVMGLLIIASPWIFGFARSGSETWVPVFLGVSTIFYSLFTNYELGISGKISMKSHLGIDLVSGIFLSVSPWLFGFNNYVYLPHAILGLTEITAVLLSKAEPEYSPARSNDTKERSTPHAI